MLLSLYFSAKNTHKSAAIEETVSKLVLLLPPACVQQGVTSLLQSLTSEQNTIHERTVSVIRTVSNE